MKFKKMLITTVALASAMILATTGCTSSTDGNTEAEAGATPSSEMTTLKVAVVGLVHDGALHLGIEEGFFEEEGLEIETSLVANPPAGLAAAQGGQVDLVYSPSVSVLTAVTQGVDLRMIAGAAGYREGATSEDDDASLFASKSSGITSVSQLAGKTIAVPARKAFFEIVVANMLVDAGVSPEDVNWVALDFASATEALRNGTIDAVPLVSPFAAQAEDDGAVHLGSPNIEFIEQGAVAFWVASGAQVEANPDVYSRFQRAITKSQDFANENSELAVQAGLDAVDSPLTIDQIAPPYWISEVNADDLSRANEKLVKLGVLPEMLDIDSLIFRN
ncbi:ABC transporter substrate-binding protein [Leucobacter sp. Z1108]|uniref:ABC transporter substrate-binding protein n=1 Tax=Leucobacter sp. Z1108 TaxID=3439066 RepID=UPI003F3F8B80